MLQNQETDLLPLFEVAIIDWRPTLLLFIVIASVVIIIRPRSLFIWMVISVSLLTGAFTYAVFITDFFANARSQAVTLGFVGVLAVLGWITSNAVSREHFRKSHTMDLVIKTRIGDELNWHKLNLFANLPYDKRLTCEEYKAYKRELLNPINYCPQQKKIPLIISLWAILNHYEYIAHGVRTKELDYNIIRNTLRGTILAYVNDYENVIEIEQMVNKQSFEHLVWLAGKLRKNTK